MVNPYLAVKQLPIRSLVSVRDEELPPLTRMVFEAAARNVCC
jgi:hypothetical protein